MISPFTITRTPGDVVRLQGGMYIGVRHIRECRAFIIMRIGVRGSSLVYNILIMNGLASPFTIFRGTPIPLVLPMTERFIWRFTVVRFIV